jgi:uncharacterized protein YndB with AHSA1/START domain
MVAAPRADVWAVVAQPHHLPRWWPLCERVEAVDVDAWTSVLRSARGRAVRADYRVLVHEPPRRRAWALEVAGTPFERLLREQRTEVELAAAPGGGTEVTLTEVHRPRGTARLGGFLMRRAARRRLDEALDALAQALEGRSPA